jgi:hypothetical protein
MSPHGELLHDPLDGGDCGDRVVAAMSTREEIIAELRRKSPQTPAMIQERVGKYTVQLLCRVLAMDGVIEERRFGSGGTHWYAYRASAFCDRTFLLAEGRGSNWRVFRLLKTEAGARQESAWWARTKSAKVRLIHDNRILAEWDHRQLNERDSWRKAKGTLQQLRSHLRTKASTPAHSSPR